MSTGDHPSLPRRRTRPARARQVAGALIAVLATIGMVAWLGAEPGEPGSRAARVAEQPPTAEVAAGTPRPQLSRRPSRRPAVLAGQLVAAERVIQDPAANAQDLAAAALLQQLGTGRLLSLTPALRNATMRRLDRATRLSVVPKLSAGRALGQLTHPASGLPAWRIVEPPPPATLMSHYRAAQRASGVPWQFLAAINLVETRMGRIRGTSTAGAQGPMQFIPGTWAIYGRGSVHDHRDAIMAAARLLRANGAPRRMDEAVYHYNLSRDYVRAVRAYAEHMQRDPRAYRGYYHWQVVYRHAAGTVILPHGYPKVRPQRL